MLGELTCQVSDVCVLLDAVCVAGCRVQGSVSGGGGGGLVPTITFEDDRDDEWTHVHTTY